MPPKKGAAKAAAPAKVLEKEYQVVGTLKEVCFVLCFDPFVKLYCFSVFF